MQVRIDTRPLPIVIFSRWWRFPVFLLLTYLLYYFYGSPPPDGLSVNGFRALLVFFACIFLWVTQLLPMPVTGLFALVAPVLLGVVTEKQAYSFFGTEAVFFILGVFVLATALYKSGLSTRMALFLLKSGAKSPRRLIFQVMFTAAILSFVMSEHAVAAMMFPLIVIITKKLSATDPKASAYSSTLFLAMAWGCVIGGIATMLGGARVPLAVGLLRDAYPDKIITFSQWSIAMFPLVVVLFTFCYLLLSRFYPIQISNVGEAEAIINQQIRDCGRLLMEEKFLALLLICTVAAWIFLSGILSTAAIAILSVVFLFMFRVVKWRHIQEQMEWGVILMYGGAIAMSSILNTTDAGKWFAQTYVQPHLSSPWTLVIALSLLTMALTEALSNAAVVAIVVPLGLTIAKQFGMDPKVVIYAVASASSMNYVLPMSTPAVALAYSSGFLRIREVIIPAAIMWVASWATLMLTAKYWWPYLGVVVQK